MSVVLGWIRLLPSDGVLAPRTLHPLPFPVDRELVQGKGPGFVCLPPRIRAGGANQANTMVHLTSEQEIGVNISSIDQMFPRRKLSGGQSLMDSRCALHFMNGCGGGHHMREKINHRRLTRFSEMNHIAG